MCLCALSPARFTVGLESPPAQGELHLTRFGRCWRYLAWRCWRHLAWLGCGSEKGPRFGQLSRAPGHRLVDGKCARSFDQHHEGQWIASRWYSKPSPPCVPDQFMKKPFSLFTLLIATTIFAMIPNAASRAISAALDRKPPKNSAQMARNARGAGMPNWRKEPVVTCKPNPPNQPSILWAPWMKKVTPNTRRAIVKVRSLV